jgi:Asp-tRNA(Asn)/Glu-tRNA(Gln) amidotransferase A subunit family amidase
MLLLVFPARKGSSVDISVDIPDKFIGAPIALQVVGKHFRDEDTMAAAEMISKIIQE